MALITVTSQLHFAHAYPMYIACLVSLSMVGETSNGIGWGSSNLIQSLLFHFILVSYLHLK